MAFFKTVLPRLLSRKALKAKVTASAEQEKAPVSTEKEKQPVLPDGILFYVKAGDNNAVLAVAALELVQLCLNLLETIQGLSSDGKTGLPLQLYPQFEQKENQIGFRLFAEEEVLEKVLFLIKKMQRHLLALAKGNAKVSDIPASWAKAYRHFFKRVQQYQQSIELVDSNSQSLLCSFNVHEIDNLLVGLEKIKSTPKQLNFKGEITGFSQNNHRIEFQVETNEWNGIRTKKAVAQPMSCRASKKMIEFAKKYLDQEVEFEALVRLDEHGKKQYQLLSILIKTDSGIIKERIVPDEGPRGGQFYLSYMGKRVYLSK